MRKKHVRGAFVLGTRPEIIKLSPLIRLYRKKKISFVLIHTGQHYSYEMDRLFFEELGLPRVDHALGISSSGMNRHGKQTGRMLEKIEGVLLREKPSVVFVQGDTNSVLAGSLAASKIPGVRLAHVEAGLRSYDRTMPEELNRITADHLADFLFAPTRNAKQILLGEGIGREKIFVTGNTVVDALLENVVLAKKRVPAVRKFMGTRNGYILMTLHRQENVDDPVRLRRILGGVDRSSRRLRQPVVFPAHPRTLHRLKQFGVKIPSCLHVVPPMGFLDFLNLEAGAALILTDSGGVQEEACVLKVPCVTLRTTTERPETVAVGANRIAGYDSDPIYRAALVMAARRGSHWSNPFGDGQASRRMLAAIQDAGC